MTAVLKQLAENKAAIIGVLVFIALNMVFTYFEVYYFNLLPFVLLVTLLAFYRLDAVFYFTIFCIPLSVPLFEITKSVNFNLNLPSEVLVIGLSFMFIMKLIYERKIDKRIIYHPISLAIYFNLFWLFITSITSTMPLVSFKYLLSRIWFIIPFYFLAAHIFSKTANIRTFLWAYIIPLLIVIVYTIARHTGYGLNNKEAAHFVMNPFYRDHTSYGAMLAMYIPVLASFLLRTSRNITIQVFSFIATFIIVAAFILSYTRAAWLSILVVAALYVIILLKIKFRTVLIGLILLIPVILSVRAELLMRLEKNDQESSDDLMEHVQSMSNITSDASNLERINRWKCAIKMFAEKPVFGWGPGTYQFQYAPFQLSYDKTIITTNFGDGGNAHSEYIGPLSESGVLGSLSFIVIAIMALIYGFKLYFQYSDRAYRMLSLSITLGLITYLIHGVLNNFLDTDKAAGPFWGFIAILVALDVYHCKPEHS